MPGRKVFTRERATSADVQTYLMDQTVMRFASASARDLAIPSPSNGMMVWLDSPGVFMERVAGSWVTSSINAGVSGFITGSAPPTGAPLILKTYRGNIVTNASGDATLAYPAGPGGVAAFPNGVLGAWAVCATTSPIFLAPNTSSLSALNIRAYTNANAVAASLSILSNILVIGW